MRLFLIIGFYLALSSCASTKELVVSKVLKAEFPPNRNSKILLLIQTTGDGHLIPFRCEFAMNDDNGRIFAATKIEALTKDQNTLCRVVSINEAAYKKWQNSINKKDDGFTPDKSLLNYKLSQGEIIYDTKSTKYLDQTDNQLPIPDINALARVE